MKTKELKSAILDLPIDQRIEIADYILESLNRPDQQTEEAWLKEIERRENTYKKGKANMVPGEKVISSIRERLAK